MTAMETDDIIDLEAYATNYTGHGKTARLQFIAKQAAGSQLELDALRMAADELKKGINTRQYEEVMQKINGRLGTDYTADSQWISKAQSKGATDLARLENALTGSKTSLRKEAIRLGHVELARHHLATGNLQEAFKCFVRTRDYCTTPADILGMCLHVITTSLATQSWTNVHNYASKAEGVPDVSSHPVQHSKVKCAEAVALVQDGRYKAAARRFTEASPEMGSSFSEALAPGDIATMGALCALASLSRPELKRQVVDNLDFREYLEAVPEVRDMVHDFHSAQYAQALERLAKLTPVLRLDLHLAGHVTALTQALRSRAIVQYTQSFVAVKIASMSDVFSCDAEELEAELARLIGLGQVAGRLDGHAKVLRARRPNQRSLSFKAALAAGDEYLFNAQAALLRASLTKHDMIQRPAMMPKKGLGFRDL